jgi:hypothetical protein
MQAPNEVQPSHKPSPLPPHLSVSQCSQRPALDQYPGGTQAIMEPYTGPYSSDTDIIHGSILRRVMHETRTLRCKRGEAPGAPLRHRHRCLFTASEEQFRGEQTVHSSCAQARPFARSPTMSGDPSRCRIQPLPRVACILRISLFRFSVLVHGMELGRLFVWR